MNNQQKIREYLNNEFLYPIRDPLWRHIYLSKGLKIIVAHPRFQKLTGIRQLGPAFLAYPGATHTRFNHSLGVFELAKRTLVALLRSDFAATLTIEGVKAFLCAALLHDLGHFPYAHSLKELPLKEHERLTGQIILSTDLSRIIRSDIGTDPEYVASIIDLAEPAPDDESEFYRRILSGVLDPDKLDYLNRDAFFCGVPYGIQDIDFALSKLGYTSEIGMTIDADGMTAVENVLFSKYLMYRTVYWHKTVRAATAMIKKAVLSAMRNEVIRPDDLYGLDDEDFTRQFTRERHHAFRLIENVAKRHLFIPVYEAPVSDALRLSARAANLADRADLEEKLASEMSVRGDLAGDCVVVDVPEPITFEAELSIQADGSYIPFPDSGTVFDRTTVDGFTKSLRKFRIFVDPAHTDGTLDYVSIVKSVVASQ